MRFGVAFRPWTAFLILLLAAAGYVSLRPEVLVLESLEAPLFTGALALAALAIAIWSRHRTTRRLLRLAEVAEAMTDGEYSERCDDSGDDTLARVSAAINQLAERVDRNLARLQDSEEQIRDLAYRDSLTGLPNRRMFEDLLEREIVAARRYKYGLALAILDVDNLKDVNDSLGHRAGDALLEGVAQRLAGQLRGSDVLARLGGDEFGLLMRASGRREHILPALTRLLRRVREPFDVEERRIMTSLSIGLCFFPEDGSGPRDLMSNADFALYQAKHEGRNNVRQFDQSMNDLSNQRIRLEQDLRRAMESDEFALWYQPIVCLRDRGLVGLEGLVRWNHPKEGLLLPGRFVSLAEETGLMPQIGYRVLMKACRRAALWQEQGYRPLPISVNVSVRQLQAGDFVDILERVLTLTELRPEFLKLEITENLAAEGPRVLDHLSKISGWGVRLAIDDFGTGYSSFSYLLKHRIDTIKIDRSFVSGIPRNPDSVAIVKAILSLARSLDLEVVAEGIETQEQLDFLLDNGCLNGQGHLFLRPAPKEEIEPHLRRGRITPVRPELVHPLAAAGHLLSRKDLD